MTALTFIRILAICAVASALATTPADACENGRCEPGPQVTTSQPLKLNSFRRKPVATSATRTVKRRSGEYAKVTATRRSTQNPARPQVTPETISPAAAQAFASYEVARVRVVTPEETSGLIAQAATASMNDATIADINNVQVVSADEINDIDRKADSPRAVSLDALSRDLAGSAEPKAEDRSWLQRMLVVIGSAFAAVVTLVRTLLG